MYKSGKIALGFFLLANLLIVLNVFHWIFVLLISSFLCLLTYRTSLLNFQIAIQSTFLGWLCAISIHLWMLYSYPINLFAYYLFILSIFHFGEFISIAFTNPKELNASSFMIDHSIDYCSALVASWIEFFLECYFVPTLKSYHMISVLGLCLCIIGEVIRKLSIFTAKSNFNHKVQHQKHDHHILITHGIYSYFRHPAYFGWFLWAISTQIILQNPICFIGYLLVVWKFMNVRIIQEEYYLIQFFGNEYKIYQKNVPTRIPFCNGYIKKIQTSECNGLQLSHE